MEDGKVILETVDISDISQDPANVRKHSERNLESIAASLRAFGQQKPIVVDKRGVILAGNGTYEAAKRIGWDKIKITRTDLSGTMATAYAIADNRTAELAEWDDTALAEQLRALQSEEFDLANVGYTDDEVDGLIKQIGDEIIESDDWPEINEPDSHSVVVRYKKNDIPAILSFINEQNHDVLTNGKCGEKIIDKIRQKHQS